MIPVGSLGQLPTTLTGPRKGGGRLASYGFSGNALTNIWNYSLSPVGPFRVIATTVAVVAGETGDKTTLRQANKVIYTDQENTDRELAPYGIAVLGAFIPPAGVIAKAVYQYGPAAEHAAEEAQQRSASQKDALERILERTREKWFSYGWGYGSMFAGKKQNQDEDEELIDDEDKPPKKWLKKQKEKEKQQKQQQKDAQASAAMVPFTKIFPGAAIPKERNSIFTLPYPTTKKEQGTQSIFSGVFTDKQSATDSPSGFSGSD